VRGKTYRRSGWFSSTRFLAAGNVEIDEETQGGAVHRLLQKV